MGYIDAINLVHSGYGAECRRGQSDRVPQMVALPESHRDLPQPRHKRIARVYPHA